MGQWVSTISWVVQLTSVLSMLLDVHVLKTACCSMMDNTKTAPHACCLVLKICKSCPDRLQHATAVGEDAMGDVRECCNTL